MTPTELKAQRIAAGLSRPELEKLAGLDGKSQPGKRLYEYETGIRGITPAMATLFGLIFDKKKLKLI